LLFFSVSTFAQGDLYVTNRVILEGRKMNEVLSLANTGDKAATYSISFVQRRMNEDGSFTSIDASDEGAPFADPYLRIYPRQVTLEPKEGQSIVLQVRRTVNMPDGEYRSHIFVLRMTTLPSKETNDTLKQSV
jgi:P pilus assembly chaperone PapD